MSGYEFALCRIVFAIYLMAQFVTSILNALLWSDFQTSDVDLWIVISLMSIGLLASCCLFVGWCRRGFALVLLGVVSLHYSGAQLWLHLHSMQLLIVILYLVLIRQGEPLSVGPDSEEWQIKPRRQLTLFNCVMCVYTLFGIAGLIGLEVKAGGAALGLEEQFAQAFLAFAGQNGAPGRVVGSIYVLALPLTLFRRLRPWTWLTLLATQCLSISMYGNPADLFAVVVTHLFIFDRRWLPPKASRSTETNVVFFDGVCGLCNWAIDFIVAEDSYGLFQFAPIQGKTAEAINSDVLKSGQSMALRDGKQLLYRSDAALEIAASLGGIWRIISWARIVPRPLRDGLYFIIQHNRYRWFGKRDTCRLPTPAEAARFLP